LEGDVAVETVEGETARKITIPKRLRMDNPKVAEEWDLALVEEVSVGREVEVEAD
jgi:hypothetical protein